MQSIFDYLLNCLFTSSTAHNNSPIAAGVVCGPKLNLTAFSLSWGVMCMASRTGRLFFFEEQALPVEI